MRCIYCYKECQPSEFSLEHIFPKSLGGNLPGDYFETNQVCVRCNSLMGRYVDGAFIKSWFTKNYKAEDATRYIDLENGSPLPLIYMGICNDVQTVDDEVCEMWLGPCGDPIYHFHKIDDDNQYDSYAGGDVIARKKDPGYAFLFLTTKHEQWIKVVLLSFRYGFRKAARYPGNFDIEDANTRAKYIESVPDNKRSLLENLKGLGGQTHRNTFVFKTGIEKRFLCKVGIGMGFKLFGQKYLESDYYHELKHGLWNFGKDDSEEFNILGSGDVTDLLGPDGELVAWEGGHTILIIPNSDIGL